MDAEKNHLALRLFVISSSWDNLSYNAVIFSCSNRFSLIANSLQAAGSFVVCLLYHSQHRLSRLRAELNVEFCH